MVPVLPPDLSALYSILANPVTAGIVLSMLLENMPFIENAAVANWKKALVCLLTGIVWALVITLVGPNGLPTSANGVYSIIVSALAVVFSMNVWHTVVIVGLPTFWAGILALFGVTTTTATSPLGKVVTVKKLSGQG